MLWSKLSVKSKYIHREAKYAWEHDKLVPVRIAEVELPFLFKDTQAGNLIGWDGSDSFPGFRKLLKDLAFKMGIAKTTEIPKENSWKKLLPLPPPKLDLKRSVLISTLTWTRIAEATEYILQNSKEPSFSQCVEVYKGDKNEYVVGPPSIEYDLGFYRVKGKSKSKGKDGMWSNIVQIGAKRLG